MREIVVLLHPVLIETTSKNNNKQARARRLLRLGVVLDLIAFMKLLGVEATEGWKCRGKKKK
jgi:hypothetical protein